MRSNYKQLGNYISQVDKRNNDLSISEPKGIRINKEFMPSVANTTGTDLSKYKVVSKGQFAYNPMHVGRDEVLPISLLLESEPIIVSPAYTVFQVNDPQELDPEYLMMWCRRTEFDRNVWFTTDSSVRGGFSWESFCAMKLPVPSIEKQREIVKEYNTIVNRIRLNEQLNQKLEETAQALYKHWFVDFEFPISKEYAQSIGKPELEGKPYQSNGGEMVWNEELDKEIPKEWTCLKWGELSTLEYGKGLKDYRDGLGRVPVFGTNGQVGKTIKPMVKSQGIIIGRKGVYRGVHFSPEPFYVIDTAFYLKPIIQLSLKWAYYEILRLDINSLESGSAIPSTSRDDFYDSFCAFPSNDVQDRFEKKLDVIVAHKELNNNQNNLLKELGDLLLSKMTKVENGKKLVQEVI
jgi:type I restriction enzyme S subunit